MYGRPSRSSWTKFLWSSFGILLWESPNSGERSKRSISLKLWNVSNSLISWENFWNLWGEFMRVIQLTVQMLEETHAAEENAQPSQLKGRMLFMSTSNIHKSVPESQRRSMQTNRNSRSPTYAKDFEPSRWALFGPVDEKSGTGAWATDHKCSGTLQQFKVIQEFAASDTLRAGAQVQYQKGVLKSTKGEKKTLCTLHRGPELCRNAVEDTSRRQPAQHPLSSGIVVQQQRHGVCNQSQPESRHLAFGTSVSWNTIIRNSWSGIIFCGPIGHYLTHIGHYHILSRIHINARRSRSKTENCNRINTTREPTLDASITPHNSRFGIEESTHLLVKDGSKCSVVKFI